MHQYIHDHLAYDEIIEDEDISYTPGNRYEDNKSALKVAAKQGKPFWL